MSEHDAMPRSAGKSPRPRLRFRLHPTVHVVQRRAKGKRCRGCGRFRHPTGQWFHRNKNRPDGFQIYCKPCQRERDHRSYAGHAPERLERAKTWKKAHHDRINAWHRVYIREYRTGMRRRQPELDVPADQTTGDLFRLCSACGASFPLSEYKRRDGVPIAECRSCWNGRMRQLRAPTKRAVYRQNRRARERGRIAHDEWTTILERFNHRCAYCGADGKLTMDHVIPLSKGGTHAPDNVVPACGRCNSRKHTSPWSPRTPTNPGP